jgi:site-specific DNA-methyltransferase (adenine-specific)
MDKLIHNDRKFQFILTDLPYGNKKTNCKWDVVLPFAPIWEKCNALVESKHSPMVFFSGEPFTSLLITSNIKGFKYRWDWDKGVPSGMNYAKYRPMQQTEDICVFTQKGDKTTYYPQKTKREKPIKSGGNSVSSKSFENPFLKEKKEYKKTYTEKNPITIVRFMKIRRGSVHPTQKPVPLLEYLLKTYTKEEDWVLDFTMGSGSTGVACINLNRNFVGIEKNTEYFKVAQERVYQ